MSARHSRRIVVYRYKARWPMPEFLPKWGTWDAIRGLDGCIPIGSSARQVPASDINPDGFLPLDVTPDDLEMPE